LIICDANGGSQIVGSEGAQYVVQDSRFSLGNQILHGMSCLLVESKMCNYFLYTKIQNIPWELEELAASMGVTKSYYRMLVRKVAILKTDMKILTWILQTDRLKLVEMV
jgi:hypothetical protein